MAGEGLGDVALPWDINVSGVWNARQGYPYIEAILVSGAVLRPRGAGDVLVPINPLGETRLATFQQIDMKVEKAFRIGAAKLSGSFEVFNLANANTILTRERQLNSTTAGNARGILAPASPVLAFACSGSLAAVPLRNRRGSVLSAPRALSARRGPPIQPSRWSASAGRAGRRSGGRQLTSPEERAVCVTPA